MLSREEFAEIVSRALREDIGAGDLTSCSLIPKERQAVGRLTAKGDGILCGLPLFVEVFRQLDPRVRFRIRRREGTRVRSGEVGAEVRGNARAILAGERTALNFVQRLSGIATLTAEYVRAVRGTRAKIFDTRKTTPGLRALEKHAVRVGGGCNHRFGLFDGVLVKDNHRALLGGGLAAAVERIRRGNRAVEVEAASMEEVRGLAEAPVDIVLLDNFSGADLRSAVRLLRRRRPGTRIEVSGGMTIARARAAARAGVDRISVGRLTHSAPALDFSLEVAAP